MNNNLDMINNFLCLTYETIMNKSTHNILEQSNLHLFPFYSFIKSSTAELKTLYNIVIWNQN